MLKYGINSSRNPALRPFDWLKALKAQAFRRGSLLLTLNSELHYAGYLSAERQEA